MRTQPTLFTLSLAVSLAGAAGAQSSTAPTPTSTVTPPNAALGAPPPASESSATNDKRHRHDRPGLLYAAASLGAGQLAVNGANDQSSYRVAGVGASFSVALGATVAPNLVVYGVVGAHQLTDPVIEANGRSTDTHNFKVTQYWLGPSVAYYLMPANVVLGASVLAARNTIEVTNASVLGQTKLGPAFAVRVGKDWWIADRLALGVTAEGVWASMRDDDAAHPGTVTSRSISIGAALTYN